MLIPCAYRFGPFRFDTASYRLLNGEMAVRLAPKVLDLLGLLLSHASELVTKEAILRALWPDVAVTDNAVTQVVSELRHGLKDSPTAPLYIQTVPRRGYRFIAVVDDEGATPRPSGPATRSASARPARRTIAVSNFKNVNDDSDVAWMATGIAETVSGDLHGRHDLSVVDRASLSGEARPAALSATGPDLDLLVVGSYQRSGDRLRITGRVISVATGEAVSHAKADGAVFDVFELQDSLVTQLLRGLHAPFAPTIPARLGGRETPSLEAYRALTEGRLKLETLDPAEVPAAILDFDRAITLDPRYAPAYVGLAHARFWLYEASRSRNKPETDELRVAIAHARRAVELDPGLGEAHAALAFFLASAGRHAEALEAGRTAVDLEPSDWRHQFRLGMAAWGNERLEAFDAVVRLYPEFAYSYFGVAMVYVARLDLETAEEVLRQALAVQERSSAGPRRFPVNGLHWLLGLVRLAAGQPDEAHAEFDRELTARGSELYAAEYAMDAYDGHGFAYLTEGNAVAAESMFLKAIDLYPEHARSLIGLAEARRRQGGREAEARTALDQASRAIHTLTDSGRTTEAAMASVFWHVVSGRQEDGLATLAKLLDEAPPGFAGWTVPVEPLLAGVRGTSAYQHALQRLAQRAT